MARSTVRKALLYPALALLFAHSQAHASPSAEALQSIAGAASALQSSGDSVQEVFERSGKIGGKRHSQVRSMGMEDMTQAELNALPREDLKRYAAANFLGFYYVNTQTFADVCRAEGVDLAPFVREFKTKHAAQFARADMVTKGSAFSMASMSAIGRDDRERMETNVRHTMIDMAAGLHKTTVAHSCAYVAENAADVVSASDYADRFPILEAAFMSDETQTKGPGSFPASNPYLNHPIDRRRETHDESTGSSR